MEFSLLATFVLLDHSARVSCFVIAKTNFFVIGRGKILSVKRARSWFLLLRLPSFSQARVAPCCFQFTAAFSLWTSHNSISPTVVDMADSEEGQKGSRSSAVTAGAESTRPYVSEIAEIEDAKVIFS